MKRLWIVAGILLFIIGVSTAGLVHLRHVTTEMEGTLEALSQAAEEENADRARELTAAFQLEWHKNEAIMVRYIHHEALDAVTGFVALLPAYARYEQYPLLAAETERIQELLLHIREAEIPNLKNIF